MIYGFMIGLHIVVCVSMVFVVLLQSGKGGGLAGAFGGGGGTGQALFGGRGAATFLSKATTVLGIAFMTTSLLLALMSGSQGTPQSILRGAEPAPGTAPPPPTSQPLQIPGAGVLDALPADDQSVPALDADQPADPSSGNESANPGGN